MSIREKDSKVTGTILTGEAQKLFDECLACEKALKKAKRIVKMAPENGEAKALAGLLYHFTGGKKKGYELVKEGLKLAMQHEKRAICCPFCFRVYALMYKEDRNFVKAVSSFINALRYDSNNVNVLKDVGILQMQLEQWGSLVKTRRKLLTIQANSPRSWLGYAVSLYLNESYRPAEAVIAEWVKMKNGEIREEDDAVKKNEGEVERSRVLMFLLQIYGDAEMYEKLFSSVKEYRKLGYLRDRVLLDELVGKVYVKMGKKEAAADVFRKLMERSSENLEYLKFYLHSMDLLKSVDLFTEMKHSEEDENKMLKEIDGLVKVLPKWSSLKRLGLTFSRGEEFVKRFTEFVRPYLEKSVPSLFQIVKKIYENAEKVVMIEEIMEGFRKNLLEIEKLSPEDELLQAPSTNMWVLLFLGQHYDRKGQHKKGLEYVDLAIRHTPTLIESYLIKGKILRHMGNIKEACEAVDLARKLDLADRFVNTKSVKYHLLCDHVNLAHEIAYVFAQDSQDNQFNIHTMEGIHFEMNLARSYVRQSKYGMALREFDRVRQFFLRQFQLLYDFHDFYLRKCSLITFVKEIRYFLKRKKHPFYFESVREMLKIYLNFHERREEFTKEGKEKKGMSKDQKEMHSLVYVNHLEAAEELFYDLKETFPEKVVTHKLGIELFGNMDKYLLVLNCIQKIYKLEGNYRSVAEALTKIKELDLEKVESINPSAKKVFKEKFAEIYEKFQAENTAKKEEEEKKE